MKTFNKPLNGNPFFAGIFLGCLLLISCEPEPEKYGACVWDTTGGDCRAFSFRILDAETRENLVGTDDEPIHPDSIRITNSRGDNMYFILSEVKDTNDGTQFIIDAFSPFQELYCFNMCTNDSSFTRTYYMYVGDGDTDTIDVYFPERTNRYTVLFNGSTENVIAETIDAYLEYTTHEFLK